MKRHQSITSIAHALRLAKVSQRDVVKGTSISQSTLSRMAEDPWNKVDYERAEEILNSITTKTSVKGEFTMRRADDSMVESVMFIFPS